VAVGSHDDFFSPNLAIILDIEYFYPATVLRDIFLGERGLFNQTIHMLMTQKPKQKSKNLSKSHV